MDGEVLWLRERLSVFGAVVIFCIVWSVMQGPDLTWDFFQYHVYLGLHASGKSLSRDYFPADAQSYLTPYAHWPVAKLIALQMPGLVVSIVAGTIHSFALIAVWFVARELFPTTSSKDRTARAMSVAVAAAAPLVLTQIGTSYIDLSTASVSVFGVALLLRACHGRPAHFHLIGLAGACFGVATALKFTNSLWAGSAFLTLCGVAMRQSDVRWKSVGAFVVGGTAGFLVVYGTWGYMLWRDFGNPIFPMFDSAFHPPKSIPLATETTVQMTSLWDTLLQLRQRLHYRYLPQTIDAWLLRPLYMVDPVFNVYTESRAPDSRFLALALIAPAAVWLRRKDGAINMLNVLLGLFACGWVIWMGVSGNGRYMMTLALLAGPALVGCIAAVWPKRTHVAVAFITLFTCFQFVLLTLGSDFRAIGGTGKAYWLTSPVPAEITDRPLTFVGFTDPSISWISAFAHPASRFLSPTYFALPADDPNRVSRILVESTEIVAVFPYRLADQHTGMPIPSAPRAWAPHVERAGLAVDFEHCMKGQLNEAPQAIQNYSLNLPSGERIEGRGVRGFFYCRATFAPSLQKHFPTEPGFEELFDRIERECASVFFPHTATSCSQSQCTRAYTQTDSYVSIERDGGVYSGRFGAVGTVGWGSVDTLLNAPALNCHLDVGVHVPFDPAANMFPNFGAGDR